MSEIAATLSVRNAAACEGRRIMAVQDATGIKFRGRDQARRGLGRGGDRVGLGFFIHPVMAVDVADEVLLAVLEAQIWSRPAETDGSASAARRQRAPQEKGSQRWQEGAALAARHAAAHVIVVGDRENDIYAVDREFGLRVALIFTRTDNRLLRPGVAADLPTLRSVSTPLHRAFNALTAQIDHAINRVDLVPQNLTHSRQAAPVKQG